MKASAPNLPSAGFQSLVVTKLRCPRAVNAGHACLVVDQAMRARMASTARPGGERHAPEDPVAAPAAAPIRAAGQARPRRGSASSSESVGQHGVRRSPTVDGRLVSAVGRLSRSCIVSSWAMAFCCRLDGSLAKLTSAASAWPSVSR